MTKEKILIPTLTVLAVGGITAAGITTASAFFGGNEAAQEALENKDYEGFKEAVEDKDIKCGKHKILNKLDSEEEFNEFAERHNQIQAAIESGDYEAWKAAMEGLERKGPFVNKITEENFAEFTEIHMLKMDGKFEEAKKAWQAFAEKYDIEFGKRFGKTS